MSLIVTCKKCKKRMKAPEKLAGKRVRCKCGHVVAVPAELAPANAASQEFSLADESALEPQPQPIDLGDLAGMADGESLVRGQSCPECFANIPEDGVLCTACGYDMRTGRRLGTEVQVDPAPRDPSAPGAESTGRKQKKTKPLDPNAPPKFAFIRPLVKGGLILGAIALLIWGTLHFKDALFFDPQKQMEEAHLKVAAGMTVKDVVDALGRPPTDIFAVQPKQNAKNLPAKYLPAKLEYKERFITQYPREQLKYGFEFVYRYSERNELHIYFRGNGRVDSAETRDPLGLIFGKP